MRHACAIAGISYDSMITWLNPSNARYKPNLFKLFERAKAVYYHKQIDKLNRARDWRAAAFWLERHEEEFAPKKKGSGIVNQVSVNLGGKPGLTLTLTPEDLSALSAAYDRQKARNAHT